MRRQPHLNHVAMVAGTSMRIFRRRSEYGFTLIEVAVVVAIVGVLASVAMPMVELHARRQQEQELRQALREIRSALDAYKAAYDTGRIEHRVGASGYPAKLEDLVRGVTDVQSAEHHRLYFLRRLPRDPFDSDASHSAAETWGKRSYASAPDMPAEGDDVFDVYTRAAGVGLNGVAYREW